LEPGWGAGTGGEFLERVLVRRDWESRSEEERERTEAMAAETAAVFVSATARRLEGRAVKRTSSMDRLGRGRVSMAFLAYDEYDVNVRDRSSGLSLLNRTGIVR